MGEEGTGLGPTLEFYALVAAELQRKTLAIWMMDDDIHDESEREVSEWDSLCAWLAVSFREIGM